MAHSLNGLKLFLRSNEFSILNEMNSEQVERRTLRVSAAGCRVLGFTDCEPGGRYTTHTYTDCNCYGIIIRQGQRRTGYKCRPTNQWILDVFDSVISFIVAIFCSCTVARRRRRRQRWLALPAPDRNLKLFYGHQNKKASVENCN